MQIGITNLKIGWVDGGLMHWYWLFQLVSVVCIALVFGIGICIAPKMTVLFICGVYPSLPLILIVTLQVRKHPSTSTAKKYLPPLRTLHKYFHQMIYLVRY